MAREYNPFAPKECSKLETPWGVFDVASPNKSRTEAMAAIQRKADSLEESDALNSFAEIAIESTAAGLKNGEDFMREAKAAWDRDEITLDQLRGAAEFIGEELRAGVVEGND
jgi:hypothetical protein